MQGLRGFIRNKKTILAFIIYALFSAIALIFSSRTVEFKPKEWGLAIISPFQIAVSSVNDFIVGSFNSIGELRKLKENFEELKSRIEEYKTVERDRVELFRENQRLKEQLGFSQSLGYKHIAAEIIGKDPGNIFNTFIINKGRNQGIEKDMPVVAFQNGFQGLVGKIVEVSTNTAKILPLFDPQCFVSARLQSSRYEGLINGNGDATSSLHMRHVHKRAREETRFGDLVVTSGLMSIYPKGIFIGKVLSFSAQEWDTSLDIEIEPIIDFSRLEYVFVLDLE